MVNIMSSIVDMAHATGMSTRNNRGRPASIDMTSAPAGQVPDNCSRPGRPPVAKTNAAVPVLAFGRRSMSSVIDSERGDTCQRREPRGGSQTMNTRPRGPEFSSVNGCCGKTDGILISTPAYQIGK